MISLLSRVKGRVTCMIALAAATVRGHPRCSFTSTIQARSKRLNWTQRCLRCRTCANRQREIVRFSQQTSARNPVLESLCDLPRRCPFALPCDASGRVNSVVLPGRLAMSVRSVVFFLLCGLSNLVRLSHASDCCRACRVPVGSTHLHMLFKHFVCHTRV